MRYLGIDFGSKKIGLAMSDPSGSMAFPHAVWPSDGQFREKLWQLLEKEEVGAVVIGHSLDRDGEPNKIQAAVEDLMLAITLEVGLPVHLENEQYTTQAAMRLQGKNSQTDASAAALILDSFLQKQK